MPPDDTPSLTAAQREQIESLRRQNRQHLAAQRDQLRAKHVELRTLWLAEPPNEPAILKKLAEIDAIRAALRPALVKRRLAHLALLTREQRQALWTARPAHECPHQGRHLRRMPGQPILTPRAEEMMPGLDADDDFGIEGTLELDPMPCLPSELHPPSGSLREVR
jgi:hypothetical protein